MRVATSWYRRNPLRKSKRRTGNNNGSLNFLLSNGVRSSTRSIGKDVRHCDNSLVKRCSAFEMRGLPLWTRWWKLPKYNQSLLWSGLCQSLSMLPPQHDSTFRFPLAVLYLASGCSYLQIGYKPLYRTVNYIYATFLWMNELKLKI